MFMVAGSFLVSIVATLGVIAFNLMRLSLKEQVGEKPIAKSGGIAFMIPFIAAWIYIQGFGIGAICMILAVIFGAISDFKDLKIGWYFISTIILGIMIIAGGYTLAITNIGLINILLTLVIWSLLLWGVHKINDLDGQVVGVGVLINVGVYLIQGNMDYLALILGTSLLGFLIFNMYPTRAYVGASGCYGLSMALMLIVSEEIKILEGGISGYYPLVLFSIIILDGIIGGILLIERGFENWSVPESYICTVFLNNYYLNQRVVVLIYYGIVAVTVAFSVAYIYANWIVQMLILATILAFGFTMIWYIFKEKASFQS